jgi:dihydropteroate synthase
MPDRAARLPGRAPFKSPATALSRVLHAGRFRLALDAPLVMGIVNVTPDSFSDGGTSFPSGAGVEHARRLVEEGAHLLDVGGESTRPRAAPVGAQEELDRVMPVVEAFAGGPVPVSVDTGKPEVMRAALAAGAAMINDVYGLRAAGALEAVATSDAAVCVMHMQGEPRTMQLAPVYGDVVAEVGAFLRERVGACEAAGIQRSRILADPGFGFGKTTAHNLELLRRMHELEAAAGVPLLVGLSRKSLLGQITGRPVGERVHASVAAALAAVARGAAVVRVHDVAATRDALAVWRAVQEGSATERGGG